MANWWAFLYFVLKMMRHFSPPLGKKMPVSWYDWKGMLNCGMLRNRSFAEISDSADEKTLRLNFTSATSFVGDRCLLVSGNLKNKTKSLVIVWCNLVRFCTVICYLNKKFIWLFAFHYCADDDRDVVSNLIPQLRDKNLISVDNYNEVRDFDFRATIFSCYCCYWINYLHHLAYSSFKLVCEIT